MHPNKERNQQLPLDTAPVGEDTSIVRTTRLDPSTKRLVASIDIALPRANTRLLPLLAGPLRTYPIHFPY